MALNAGTVVIPGADFVLGQIVRAMPLFGVVESSGGGSPPVDVVVAWEDGTRVSYAVTQDVGSMLLGLGATADPTIIAQVVDPVPGIPNPGGAFRGPVVACFNVRTPDGGSGGDVVIVQVRNGFYLLPVADVIPRTTI